MRCGLNGDVVPAADQLPELQKWGVEGQTGALLHVSSRTMDSIALHRRFPRTDVAGHEFLGSAPSLQEELDQTGHQTFRHIDSTLTSESLPSHTSRAHVPMRRVRRCNMRSSSVPNSDFGIEKMDPGFKFPRMMKTLWPNNARCGGGDVVPEALASSMFAVRASQIRRRQPRSGSDLMSAVHQLTSISGWRVTTLCSIAQLDNQSRMH